MSDFDKAKPYNPRHDFQKRSNNYKGHLLYRANQVGNVVPAMVSVLDIDGKDGGGWRTDEDYEEVCKDVQQLAQRELDLLDNIKKLKEERKTSLNNMLREMELGIEKLKLDTNKKAPMTRTEFLQTWVLNRTGIHADFDPNKSLNNAEKVWDEIKRRGRLKEKADG